MNKIELDIKNKLEEDTGLKILHRNNSSEYKIGNGLVPYFDSNIDYNPLNGYVSLNGNLVINPEFTYASGFDNGYAVVKRNNKSVFEIIDINGNTVIELPNFFINTRNIIDGFIPVCNSLEDNRWGLIKFHPDNKSIELIMPFVWDYMEDALNGYPHVGVYIDKPAISENEPNWEYINPIPTPTTYLYHLSHENHEKFYKYTGKQMTKEQFMFLIKYSKDHVLIDSFKTLEQNKKASRERITLGYSLNDDTNYLKDNDLNIDKTLKL